MKLIWLSASTICSGNAGEAGWVTGWVLSECSTRRKHVSDSDGPCIACKSSLREMTGNNKSNVITKARNCTGRGTRSRAELFAQNKIKASEVTAHATFRNNSIVITDSKPRREQNTCLLRWFSISLDIQPIPINSREGIRKEFIKPSCHGSPSFFTDTSSIWTARSGAAFCSSNHPGKQLGRQTSPANSKLGQQISNGCLQLFRIVVPVAVDFP
jgi:hypothetical protein